MSNSVNFPWIVQAPNVKGNHFDNHAVWRSLSLGRLALWVLLEVFDHEEFLWGDARVALPFLELLLRLRLLQLLGVSAGEGEV